MLHIGSEAQGRRITAGLEARDLDVEELLRTGQLEIEPVRATYTPGDRFDPDARLEGYRAAVEAAVGAGYAGLRVGADGTPLLHEGGHGEHGKPWTAYELRADLLASQSAFVALCAYDRGRCDPQALAEAESVHALRSGRADPEHVIAFNGYGTEDGGLALAGELDLAVLDSLSRCLDAAAGDLSAPLIDVSEVTFADVASVRAIARTAGGLARSRGHAQVRGASPLFQKVWEIAGFDHVAPAVALT